MEKRPLENKKRKTLTIAVIIFESLWITLFSVRIADELSHIELVWAIFACAGSGEHFFHFSIQLHLVRSSISISLKWEKKNKIVWLKNFHKENDRHIKSNGKIILRQLHFIEQKQQNDEEKIKL